MVKQAVVVSRENVHRHKIYVQYNHFCDAAAKISTIYRLTLPKLRHKPENRCQHPDPQTKSAWGNFQGMGCARMEKLCYLASTTIYRQCIKPKLPQQ